MPSIEELEKTLKATLKELEAVKKQQQKKTTKKTTKKSKKTDKKPAEKTPELPYSAVSDILKNMKPDESISRFGILYNADNPYNISGKSIEKFYIDYNIKAYKKWYMSYNNKDIIIDNQLSKHQKFKDKNINARIKVIEEKLKSKPKNKNVNQAEKIEEFLLKQLDKLEGKING